jgi:hypothetical protein
MGPTSGNEIGKKYREKKEPGKSKHRQQEVFFVQPSFASKMQLSEQRLCQFAEPSLTSDTVRQRGSGARTTHPFLSFRFFSSCSFCFQLSFTGMDAIRLNES